MKRLLLRRSLVLGSLVGITLLSVVILLGFGWLGGGGHRAAAATADYYASGTSGYDISYPQCSNPAAWPSGGSFRIVGATGGRAFTANACLASEFSWATSITAPAASLYMNLNYAVGSTASEGQSGPAGTCAKSNKACMAYNYGYNAAGYAFGRGASSTMWWLDIETGNSWSQTQSLNDDVIEGAVDYIQRHGATAGIYSTAAMWKTIAGSTYQPGTVMLPGTPTDAQVVANWVPGGSANSCVGISPLYTGGQVWLAQYATSPADADYAC